VPLSRALREAGDEGVPLVIGHPEDPAAMVLQAIAQAIVTAGASKIGVKLPVSGR
jgi:ATP-binding protein involved in chromosome partitioning